jgi:hypothetical protein
MRETTLSLAFAVFLVACGSTDLAVTTTVSTVTITSVKATTSSDAVDSTAPFDTPTTVPRIDVEFGSGEIHGTDVFQIDLDETVDIWVLSDVDEEIHVHGYDLYFDLVAGEPHHLSFVADIPGVFDVEIHTGHTLLFELRVGG